MERIEGMVSDIVFKNDDNGYIFHILDYQLFYNNLKENVKKRTSSYLSNTP